MIVLHPYFSEPNLASNTLSANAETICVKSFSSGFMAYEVNFGKAGNLPLESSRIPPAGSLTV